MRNSRIRIAFLATLAALLCLPVVTNAQSSLMYGSSRNPLMNSQNPAFFPSRSKGYVTLPNFNISLNSPVSLNSLATYDAQQDKTIINANNLLDTLSSDNFRLGLNIVPFGFGVNLKKIFFTFSTQVKTQFALGIPQGIVTFLNEGNYNHTGDDVVELINGNFINATVYGEAALGAGYRVNDNIIVGLRVKGLMGILDLSNGGSSLTLRTSPDYKTLTANLDLDMNFTMPGELKRDADSNVTGIEIKNYTPKNYGVSFDLGARYVTDLFEVSASVLDLGPGIKWTEGIHKVVSKNENNSFTFTGMDISDAMHGGQIDTGFAQMLIDTLKTLGEYKIIDGGDPYWTSIPTKINLGGMFNINEYFSTGLHFHGEFERGLVKDGDEFKSKLTGFFTRTSLLGRANVKDWMEFIISASVLQSHGNWDWFNPGAGLTLTPFRTLQLYLFVDYISALPIVDAKQVNLTFGLNVLIARSNNK
ncbi:MAG: hypothetical protein IJP80_03310 [Bacteroidales bacterium]|nr:hypothetical protein [Bacteroidales bacterium]